MAVTIIKEGKIPERRFRVTCKKCGTVFEFLDTDALQGFDDEKETKPMWGINCPLCNEFKYFYESDIVKQRI